MSAFCNVLSTGGDSTTGATTGCGMAWIVELDEEELDMLLLDHFLKFTIKNSAEMQRNYL